MLHTCRSQYPSGSVQLMESCHLFLRHDALDARDEFDGVHRGGIAGDLHVIRDALHLGSDDGDLPSGLLRQ
jgi:hypothetical protein